MTVTRASSPPTSRRRTNASQPRIALLDGFELQCGDEAIELPKPAQRLLVFLVFHERALLRSHVAGSLWPDASQSHAAASLCCTSASVSA